MLIYYINSLFIDNKFGTFSFVNKSDSLFEKLCPNSIRFGKILSFLCGGARSNFLFDVAHKLRINIRILFALAFCTKCFCMGNQVKTENGIKLSYKLKLCSVIRIKLENIVKRGYGKRCVKIIVKSILELCSALFKRCRRYFRCGIFFELRNLCNKLVICNFSIFKIFPREYKILSLM